VRARSPGTGACSKAVRTGAGTKVGVARVVVGAAEGAQQMVGGCATPLNDAASASGGGGRAGDASARGGGGGTGKSAKKPPERTSVGVGARGMAEKSVAGKCGQGYVQSQASSAVCALEVTEDDNSWDNGWTHGNQVSAGGRFKMPILA
jgi:hypothetical protein